MRDTLVWISAFLSGEEQFIVRRYDSEEYHSRGDKVDFDLDASPWGLGGILRVNGVFTSYFASALDEHDLSRFGFALGDAKGQQTWECLVVLVALRLWLPRFRDKRVCLRVRSDSVAALQML